MIDNPRRLVRRGNNFVGFIMSDIPKGKRKLSKLEAVHKAYAIRSRITQELLVSFGYSQKKFENHIKKVTEYIRDPEEREAKADIIREQEQNFNLWMIQRERNDMLNSAKGIVNHLIAANTVYPTYTLEFEERRVELDRAMECCNTLQQELQYIAEVLPDDKNKFTEIALEVHGEFQMIKSLRQSDNRFISHLKKW